MTKEPKIMTTLRAILMSKNWSSMEASRQAGIPQSVIYRFQNGGGLSLESVEKLAKALGLGLLAFSVPDGKKPKRGVKLEKPAPVAVNLTKAGRVSKGSAQDIAAESKRRAAKYKESPNFTKEFRERQAKEQRAAAAKKTAKKGVKRV